MLLFFLLTVTAVAAEEKPLKGRLCWMAPQTCTETSGVAVAIDPQDDARRFVWMSGDGSRVVLGEAAAGATSVDVTSPDLRRISLSLDGAARRGWPLETRVDVKVGRKPQWEWVVPASDVVRLREILLPRGDYTLVLKAPHHKTHTAPVAARESTALKQLTLQPLPVVSGRAIRVDEEQRLPLAGVQIVGGDGEVHGASAADGSFRVEISEPIPGELLLIPPGLATHVIPLVNLGSEVDAGDIEFERGARVVLTIRRGGEAREPVRVRLLRELERKHELLPMSVHELPADRDELVIPNVSPGEYQVLVEGDEEFERMTAVLNVGEDAVTKELSIEPYTLTGMARFGEEALAGGSIELSGRAWRTKIQIDARGEFGGTFWQQGTLRGFLSAPALGSGIPVESPALGSDPSVWRIELKKRLIEGRVLDATSRQPLGGVSMRLESTSEEGRSRRRLYTKVPVAPDGTYRIAAINDGLYDVQVEHNSRLPIRRTVELKGGDESVRLDFQLEEGVESYVEVVWPDGRPVASAQVLEGVARDGHNAERYFSTDGAGRLTFRSKPRETRTFYVLPKEGSFAVARVAAAESAAAGPAARVVVPPPAGSLRIVLRDDESRPTDRGIRLMRYNGEWIPYPVIGRMRNERVGVGETRALALPAGLYEFWAVAPEPGGPTAPSAPPPAPPVRVGLSGGEEVVNVTVIKAP